RNSPGPLQQRPRCRPGGNRNNVGSEAYQLVGVHTYSIRVAGRKAKVEPHIAALDPAQFRKFLPHNIVVGLSVTIGFDSNVQDPDPPPPVGLLRAGGERPRRRPTEPRNELPPSHARLPSPSPPSGRAGWGPFRGTTLGE